MQGCSRAGERYVSLKARLHPLALLVFALRLACHPKPEGRRVVPLVRLELTLLAETDFESVASTNSATGARGARLEPSPGGGAS